MCGKMRRGSIVPFLWRAGGVPPPFSVRVANTGVMELRVIKSEEERRTATEKIGLSASLFADFFCERVKEYKSERVQGWKKSDWCVGFRGLRN